MRKPTKSLGEKIRINWIACVAQTALRNCVAKQWASTKLSLNKRLKTACSKKHDRPLSLFAAQSMKGQWMGRPRMRHPASEKLEIIGLLEETHLLARLTLAKLVIRRTTFYGWCDRYLQRGEAGLQDQSPKPKHVWNRVPDQVKRKVVQLAPLKTELSPRELSVTSTHEGCCFLL
ncbi:MAG: helix-turn-helix domain-containing protein [Roseobacter sp.]